MSIPKSRIFDPDFRYVPAERTDLRRIFARERKRLSEERKTVVPMPAVLRKVNR